MSWRRVLMGGTEGNLVKGRVSGGFAFLETKEDGSEMGEKGGKDMLIMLDGWKHEGSKYRSD